MSTLAGSVSTIAQALVLAVAALGAALIFRGALSLWYALRSHGYLPIVVQSADLDSGDAFIAMLRTYIAEDVQGAWTLVPGAPNIVTPDIPTESPKALDGWIGNVYRLVNGARPAYHIVVATLPSPGIKLSVQVLRRPGNKFVGARTFEADALDDLVFQVGGYCVEQVQQQRRVLSRTPRWEHWANRGGYGRFRRALDAEHRGDVDDALREYDAAGALSLGNVTLALRRASILERGKRHLEAIQTYYYCQTLWPEAIESMYRYAAACSNLRDTSSRAYGNATGALTTIRESLRLRSLARRWMLAALPGRRNAGERRYWSDWLRSWGAKRTGTFRRRSKRRDFLCAVRLAEHVVPLAEAVQRQGLRHEQGRDDDPPLAERLAAVRRELSRKRIGWMAHYNGACFHSLCAQLPPERFGSGEDARRWRSTHVDLALGELASVVRDPFNRLDPQWMLVDPDLAGLRGSATANHWAHFLGIDLATAQPEEHGRRWQGDEDS